MKTKLLLLCCVLVIIAAGVVILIWPARFRIGGRALVLSNPGASGSDASVAYSSQWGCWCQVSSPSINPTYDLLAGQPFTIGGKAGCYVAPGPGSSFIVVANCADGSPLHYAGAATGQRWSYGPVTEPAIVSRNGQFRGRDIFLKGQEGDTANVAGFSGSMTQGTVVNAFGYPALRDGAAVLKGYADNAGVAVEGEAASGVAVRGKVGAGVGPTFRAQAGASQGDPAILYEARDASNVVVFQVLASGAIVRKGGVTDEVGAGPPSGACVNGSTYRRHDAGANDPLFYTCRNKGWAAN
jgi:hypothetical protein